MTGGRATGGRPLSSAAVPATPSSPPTPDGTTLPLPGEEVDLRTRVLVVGVVPPPRFGRENEVVATVDALAGRGADLVDVSHGPRLVGPAARASRVVIAARGDSLDAAAAAGRAGAAVVFVPAAVAAAADPSELGLGGDPDEGRSDAPLGGAAVVVVVTAVEELATGRAVADRLRVPLAFDSTRLAPHDALAGEAAAVVDGCRLLRTADVRRSRRVATVLTALCEARRG